MDNLFTALALCSLIALLLGLIKPSLVVRWGKKSRGRAFLYYGLMFIIFIALLGALDTPTHKKNGFEQKHQKDLKVTKESEVDEKEGTKKPAINSKKSLYGYMNKKGNIIVEPKFEMNSRFSSGLASVYAGHGWGFIDKKGNFVIKPKFVYAENFYEGLAYVVFDRTYRTHKGYIDKRGNVVISSEKIEKGNSFKDGYALVKIGDQYSYLDKQGNVVISSEKPNRECAFTMLGYHYSYIDKYGNEMFSLPKGVKGYDFSNGLARIEKKKGSKKKCGYIDKKGHVVIPLRFDYADNFRNGLAVVGIKKYKNKSYTTFFLIDNKGRVIFEKYHALIANVGDLPFFRRKDGRVVYIYPNGNTRESNYIHNPSGHPPSSYEFYEGLCAIEGENGKIGYINLDFEIVIKPKYEDAKPFSCGLARVKEEGKTGFIDKTGNIVFYLPSKYYADMVFSDNILQISSSKGE